MKLQFNKVKIDGRKYDFDLAKDARKAQVKYKLTAQQTFQLILRAFEDNYKLEPNCLSKAISWKINKKLYNLYHMAHDVKIVACFVCSEEEWAMISQMTFCHAMKYIKNENKRTRTIR